LWAALLAVTACGASPEGLGLGRPDFVGRGHPEPLGIAFVRLAPPGPGRATPAYLQLINRGSQTIDTQTTRLWLQTTAGSIPLPAASWTPGTLLTLQGADLDPLDLHGTAGEAIVLGPALNLEAYAAWGADPNTLPGGLNLLARSQGLPGSWQPLPYPFASDVAINLDPEAPAVPCVAGTLAATPPFATADCQGTTPPGNLWLSRIQPTGTDPNGPAVEIYNPGPNPLDLIGTQLCTRGVCQPIVPLNQSPNNVGDTWLPAAQGNLPSGALEGGRRRIVLAGGTALSENDLVTRIQGVASADEVALLAPGKQPEDGNGVLSYVRLSTLPGTLPGPTVLAERMAATGALSLWQNVTVQAPLLAGETLALGVNRPQAPWAPSAWALDASPFGTAFLGTDAPYNACSAPAAPQPPTSLVIAQITTYGGDGIIFLTNTGPSAVPLANYSLAQGPDLTQSLAHASNPDAQPLTELQPGDTLRVALSAAMACRGSYNVCWSGAGLSLATGEITLLEGNTPRGHVQWGEAALQSRYGDAAAAAGTWPLSRCRVSAFSGKESQASMVRLPKRSGQSPADYALGAAPVGADVYVAQP
jgi:hypothetical protein